MSPELAVALSAVAVSAGEAAAGFSASRPGVTVYETGGVGWKAAYTAVVGPDDDAVVDPNVAEHYRDVPITLKVANMSPPIALIWICRHAGLHCTASGDAVLITDDYRITLGVVVRTYDVSGLGNSCGVSDQVMSFVEPDRWGADLGTSIEERDGRLVVMQTPAIHAKIARLLERFRRKLDYRTVVFPVTVPANAEEKITYTVLYTW